MDCCALNFLSAYEVTGLLFVVFVVACLLSKSSCLPFMRTMPSGWPGNHSHALVLFPWVLCIYNLSVLRCVVGYNLSVSLCCIGLECNFFLTCTRNVKIEIPLVYFLSCLKVLQNTCPVLNPLAFALCVTLLGWDSTCWESRLFHFLYCANAFYGLSSFAVYQWLLHWPLQHPFAEPLTSWLPI